MEFKLTIELGNDAMKDQYDIATALRQLARDVESGREAGYVRDLNGNTVGEYALVAEATA